MGLKWVLNGDSKITFPFDKRNFMRIQSIKRAQSIKNLKRQPAGVKFGARPMTIKTNLHDKFYEEESNIQNSR